jgi:ubiquinone/menaquinone biosynthesis C-methylase UbiE
MLMGLAATVDRINRQTMRLAVNDYASHVGATPAERAAFAVVAQEMRGKRILDVGVGGGRTTPALLEISRDYTGVDYVYAMVERCRGRFPGVKFQHADARSMPEFADESFDLIVFACQGISMVDHAGRIAIIKEVRRLLSKNGVFIFSTYNRDSKEYERTFEFPEFQHSWNPLRLAVRSLRFTRNLAIRIRNRLRYARHEANTEEYSIKNDRCHDYSTMLYYIHITDQLRQLKTIGFNAAPVIYDLAGNPVATTRDDALLYLVHSQ